MPLIASTDFVVDWVAAYCCTVLMCIGTHDAVKGSELDTCSKDDST